jgi:hypothetical protein
MIAMKSAEFAEATTDDRSEASLQRIQATITSAIRVIEGAFLEAGGLASTAVGALGSLVDALQRLRLALDPERMKAIESQLEDAASALQALPQEMRVRKQAVQQLVHLGDSLSLSVDDMRECLQYLRVFAIYVKVAASGVGERSGEFGAFAGEISAYIQGGSGLLGQLAVEVEGLSSELREALTLEDELAVRSANVLADAPDAILHAARRLAAHNHRSSAAAEPAHRIAQSVRKKIAKILAALQIGDIVRQRLEHVASGLEDLQGRLSEMPGADAQRLRGAALMVLEAQLQSILSDLQSEVGVIRTTMLEFASDTHALMGYLDEMHAPSGEAGSSFLAAVVAHTSAVQEVVGDILASEARARELSHSASSTASQLTCRVDDVQRLQADVQMMAMNTRLRCSQVGADGRPLAVIALELREQASRLEGAA